MRRLLGVMIAGLLLALVLTTIPSWAGFRIEDWGDGYHDVVADDGSFVSRRSFDVKMYNATGQQMQVGTAVVLDTVTTSCPAGEFCVAAAPTGETEKIVGVVTLGLSNNGPLHVAVAGFVAVLVTGEVAAGDLLRVSATTAGHAEKAAVGGPGVFAIALEGGEDTDVWATFAQQEVF